MKTLTQIYQQMTDPKAIMGHITEALQLADPQFPGQEARFLAASEKLKKELGDATSPSAGEFLDALEAGFAASAIYIGWQGFQLNLHIFNDPLHARMLRADYEDLHGERRLPTIDAVRRANATVAAFYGSMREKLPDRLALTDGITGYYSYLETTAYKLVHYMGFCLADRFLYHVIPGYAHDPVNTLRYAQELEKYLHIDLAALDRSAMPQKAEAQP